MKEPLPGFKFMPWAGIALIIAAVVTISLGTNITLRSVEKNLPNELIAELNNLSIALEQLFETAAAADVAQASTSTENIARLRRTVATTDDILADLRKTYVVDNLVQASAFHTIVAPAIADVRRWLDEGVSGYGPQSDETIAIIRLRITESLNKAMALNRASRHTAQQILDRQRSRLDHFLFSVNVLFFSTIGITIVLIFLLIGQQRLRRRGQETIVALSDAQQSLEKNEELQRKLIATLPDFIIRTDLDGTIRYINDIALAHSGYRQSEILGKNMILFIAPEDQQRAMENTILMMEGPLGPREYHLVMKDGTQRRFEVNGDVLRNPDGTPYGLVNACRDISERQRLMEESQKLRDQLHRAEKMEALGTLAGGVAHDLNNVLGVLVGYSELMLMEIPEGDPLQKHVTNILHSGQRGAAIIQDLLTMARRGVAVSEVINLNSLIVECLKTPEAQKLSTDFADIRITTVREQDLLHIEGSPVHLSKTIMNLVRNAVESIDERGEVRITTGNRHLDRPINGYDAIKAGDYVVVSVCDTGQGIVLADLEKIFEPFYSKKVMGRSGTGLGLAVVWGTVKDHKGYVDVRSRVGQGTTFTLYFPATHKSADRVPAAIPASQYTGKGESILVVDDVQTQRDLARHMLEKCGYRVHTVSGGEMAVDYLKANGNTDLVILDMIMDPGIDGLETYRRIRQIRPEQKTVIVSGYSETDRVKLAQSMGAGPYIRKPYLLAHLGTAIRRELDRV